VHFARGRAEVLRSGRRARRSPLPERQPVVHRAVYLGVAMSGRPHSAEPLRESRLREAWLEVLPGESQHSVRADVPAAAWPRPMAVAALDAMVRPRRPEVVVEAAACATVRPHPAPVAEEQHLAQHAAPVLRTEEARVQRAEAVPVASDAPELPRVAAALAGSDVSALQPVEAAQDVAAERQPVGAAAARREEEEVAAAAGAAPHAAVGPEAVAQVAAVPLREAARAAVARDAGELRPAAVLVAQEAAPAEVPSAAASVFRQGRPRPVAAVAPRPAARSVHEKRNLRTASRSTRSLQAARDEIWSWRSRFLESLL
jgi:hypothetical protein